MKLKILLLAQLLWVCSSCDGWTPPFRLPVLGANFVCSRSSTAPLDRTFDGYYLKAGTKYWAILEDTIYTVPGLVRHDHFVLISVDKLVDSSIPANQLQTGLLAYVTYDDRDDTPYVSGLAKLRSEHFSARRVGRSVKLAYKGQVSEKLIPTEMTRESWLRFKIRVKEDGDRLICTVRKLYPLLKQEPDASDFLPCLEPLLSGHYEIKGDFEN